MLRAVQQAELEAVLQAAVTPSPSGSLPTPLSTRPSSPRSERRSACSGVVLRQETTPLHPPSGRGDKKIRQANQKPHVEYWREMLAYVDAAYRKRFGRHYRWNNLARRNLWNLARGYSAWDVMSLWDLYLSSSSCWAKQTGWSVYGMIRDMGHLIDDQQFKELARKHERLLDRSLRAAFMRRAT
jgi:hypothetical protein